jgi:hypothetical protein
MWPMALHAVSGKTAREVGNADAHLIDAAAQALGDIATAAQFVDGLPHDFREGTGTTSQMGMPHA